MQTRLAITKNHSTQQFPPTLLSTLINYTGLKSTDIEIKQKRVDSSEKYFKTDQLYQIARNQH